MTETPEFDPIAARRDEVAQYDTNIAMYTAIAATLPTEWPDHLAHFRGTTDKHKAAVEVTDLDDVTLLSQLWYGDECRAAVRAETVERTKAAAILAALEAQA
jgi:hypothetical protein